jgi:hypothetical protein
MRLWLVTALAGLALLASPAVAAPASSCSHAAVIGGKHVCLKPGASCSSRFRQAYAKYGFACDAGRLIRKVKPAVPPATVPVPAPVSKAGPFAGTWYAIDPSDLSLEQVTFGDDGSLSFQDGFATVCGGAAANATATGAAIGTTWTASAPTTLYCPDNGGTVPNVLFRFTLNPNGTVTFAGMPEVWTRSRPPG